MHSHTLKSKIQWETVEKEFKLKGIEVGAVSGGMGTFWHQYKIKGKEFYLVDDGIADKIESDSKEVIERIKDEFFEIQKA